jgi:hypothetical protein
MTKRIYARLPENIYTKLKLHASRLDISEALLAGMAIQAGLDSIVNAISPAGFRPGTDPNWGRNPTELGKVTSE